MINKNQQTKEKNTKEKVTKDKATKDKNIYKRTNKLTQKN